jgi:hypothetical protein
MHELYELKDKLLQELEEYGSKELSAGTLDVVDKLSHAVKNLCKIIEMKEDEEEYSGDMMGNRMMGGTSYARGGNRGGSRGGSSRGSYEGLGGSYARGRGSNARRDSMGRYSSERGYSRDGMEMADQLRDLMEDAPDEAIRKDIERLLRKVEQM